MQGLSNATKWFGQRIEFSLAGTGRRFDREANADILKELTLKVDNLGLAIEMGIGVLDACVAVGACAMMIAFNSERGFGAVAITAPEVQAPVAKPHLTGGAKPVKGKKPG